MPLQSPQGPHAVSTLTLELPARQERVIHGDRFQVAGTGQPAFRLRTVLFTVFYPTDSPGNGVDANRAYKHGSVSWISGSKYRSIQGLLKYAGMSKFAAIPVMLPAYHALLAKLPYAQHAPLLSHTNAQGGVSPPRQRLPTGIFSHGLGGTSTTYSSYLSALASHGMVTVALEHRDGTCPNTVVNVASEDNRRHQEENVLYINENEVEISSAEADGFSNSKWSFRRAQQEFRQAEIAEVVHYLTEIDAGRGDQLVQSCTRSIPDPLPDLSAWQGRLAQSGSLSALGHSFGGLTMLSATTTNNELKGHFRRAVLLDPWLEPLPDLTENSYSNTIPTLVINSQGFTVWRSHFDRLRGIATNLVQSQRSSDDKLSTQLYTLTGTRHTDFSDFPFLVPRLFASSVDPITATRVFSDLSRKFVQGELSPSAAIHIDNLKCRPEKAGELQAKNMGDSGVLVHHSLDS
ncbi:unnamed protein product [Sympodiomycopsis kandeliae]